MAVLLIDAVDGLTAQDMHIAGFVVDEGRGLVIAVNKWDAVEEKTGTTFDQYVEWIRHEAPFLEFAPIVSISAKTGLRVRRVLELAVDVWAERRRRVPTGELNRIVGDATARQEPPAVKGKRAEALLRHAGRRRAADVRVLRPRRAARSTSATGATSRTGCARRSASWARRSGWSSASGSRADSRCRGASRRAEGREGDGRRSRTLEPRARQRTRSAAK